MSGPLEGVRIIEMTSVVLGPWACQILGDLGADVIKVEPPFGDSNRQLGPGRNPGMCALFITCNRNKRSVVLDLKQESGRAALLKMAESADVVVHNLRPPAIKRLGLEYDEIRKINPKIIYCATYGYRADGPYSDKSAYDDSIQSASGIAMLKARAGAEPSYLPVIVADKTTAMAVVYSVTSALYHREKTGVGQEIEVPMFETMVNYVMAEHLYGRVFEPAAGDMGYARLLSPDRRPYQTKDGYIAILPYLNNHWEIFCRAAGRPDLLEDGRFADLASRLKNIDEVYREVSVMVATKTTQEWLDILTDTPVPTMIVNTLEDLLDDPHLEATGFWKQYEHPTEGTIRLPDLPTRFSETPGSVRRLPPRLGEHSVEVLRATGLSDDEIDEMLASGATKVPVGE
jgi:crotonobetainyl-CoA:carnitine CoA-transferase CaiB-like acyl-CoA transferase